MFIPLPDLQYKLFGSDGTSRTGESRSNAAFILRHDGRAVLRPPDIRGDRGREVGICRRSKGEKHDGGQCGADHIDSFLNYMVY